MNHASEDQTPTRFKRILFPIIVIAIPVLFFAVVEIALRLSHYGSGLNLVIQKQINGKTLYAINRSVGRRYFVGSGTVIPEPEDDSFDINKPENTKRIFCLGESTMAGFPYEFNATAPSLLRDRLRTEYPHYNFEVINVGLSAISSYVVLDFVRELVQYDPDLFVIYLGHNEFYGIYGAGSSIQIPGGHWAIRLTVSLLHCRTFLFLRDCIAWLKEKIATQASRSSGTLMAQMVGDQYILYNSPLYLQVKQRYERNLNSIIDVAQAQGVPVMFSSLVSNLKDHPPFHGMFAPTTTFDGQKEWNLLLVQGDSAARRSQLKVADDLFRRCSDLDSSNATAFYRLGQIQYSLGNYRNALALFSKAKDLDGLRFRATEDFQELLASTCARRGVVLARVDSAFSSNCQNGIVGRELMLEHLHPNTEGYFLMAKVFANTIKENKLLSLRDEWHQSQDGDDHRFHSLSGVTVFDSTAGRIKVSLLIHQWPFVTTDDQYIYHPSNELEAIVFNYARQKTYWSSARYQLSEYFVRIRNFGAARAECYAVSKVIPFSYQPLLRIADYFGLEEKIDSAKAAYARCYETEDNPYARIKLAVILLEQEHPADAEQQILSGFSVSEQKGIRLKDNERALGFYFLGVANAKLGKLNEAISYANRAISIDPTLTQAKGLLAQLQAVRRQ